MRVPPRWVVVGHTSLHVPRRTTAGCNAWFACTSRLPCTYEGRAVARDQCLLLAADPKPQQEPALDDITEPGGFFRYEAGFLKGASMSCRV